VLGAAKNSEDSSDIIIPRPLDEVSLVCATSQKPLNDPILLDSHMVDRGMAELRGPGGELYRPCSMPIMSALTDQELQQLKRLLSYSSALPASDSRFKSAMVFDAEILSSVPSPSLDIARVGRDFMGAIENANKTELVTRGPLDLKSSEMIPPPIVLDQEVSLDIIYTTNEFLLTGASFFYNVRVFSRRLPAEAVVDSEDAVGSSLQWVT
jgi:hypothetical protein